jgi:hypothetical protein
VVAAAPVVLLGLHSASALAERDYDLASAPSYWQTAQMSASVHSSVAMKKVAAEWMIADSLYGQLAYREMNMSYLESRDAVGDSLVGCCPGIGLGNQQGKTVAVGTYAAVAYSHKGYWEDKERGYSWLAMCTSDVVKPAGVQLSPPERNTKRL